MDSSFSVKHERQTKKHLGLYSSEFPALHLPAMEALWLSSPELNSDSCLPSSETKAPQDLEIGVAVLVLSPMPSVCNGAEVWGPASQALTQPLV